MKKALTLCLVMSLCLGLLACGGSSDTVGSTAATQGGNAQYTVEILTNAGVVPQGLKYYVYKDASRQTGIAAYGTLDNSGRITFTGPQSDGYTLVLEELPEGYQHEATYTLTGTATKVVLNTALVQGQDATGKTYVLGDIMRDFTITDSDGNTHTISELLKTKKCVVLNFWNIKCDPCKAEFPFLLKAYEAYKDDIALIAMNPMGTDTNAKIAEYKSQYGLTFPMASCSDAWIQAASPANPTTIIIDRYGRICVQETGSITGEGIFEAVFAHFVAEDYRQILIEEMEAFARAEK